MAGGHIGVRVYGEGDDTIVISTTASVRTFTVTRSTAHLLAFSNGALLRMWCAPDGIWRIAVLHRHPTLRLHLAPADDDDNYSDIVYMGDIEWVATASQYQSTGKNTA